MDLHNLDHLEKNVRSLRKTLSLLETDIAKDDCSGKKDNTTKGALMP